MEVTFSKEDLQIMAKIEKSMKEGMTQEEQFKEEWLKGQESGIALGKSGMTLDEYQDKAMSTCMPTCDNFSYMMLNLVGEVGEFSSKVAKQIRKNKMRIGETCGNKSDLIYQIPDEVDADSEWLKMNGELAKEAGDILWQLAGLCKVMGWSFERIAQMNLDKLQARKAAGTIDGSGDGVRGAERRK